VSTTAKEEFDGYPDIRVMKVTSEDNNTATSLRQEMKQL
jgi:hypothetical protein